MVTINYPGTPVLPLDRVLLQELISCAIRAAIRQLKGLDVSGSRQEIVRATDSGFATYELPAPNYRSREVWNRIPAVCAAPESKALTAYLWSRGACEKSLTRDDAAVPTRDAWERFVWGDLLHMPLEEILYHAATESLVNDGTYVPWRVDDDLVGKVAADIADTLCTGGRSICAWCPLMWVHVDPGEDLELEPGVRLRAWKPAGQFLFLTRYGREYTHDDYSHLMGDAVLEIKTRSGEGSANEIATNVADTLDRAKWALMIAEGSSEPLEESPVVIRGPGGWRGRTLRRGQGFIGNSQERVKRYSKKNGEAAASLLQLLDRVQQKTGEVRSALWLFGRACTASLARDALLDAAVGLEMLVVPNAGDSGYRFVVHGLAIIEDEEPGKLETDLKTIYKLRSKAAHGSPRQGEDDFVAAAPRARVLLAKAIHASARLIDSGLLDVVATKGDIGKAVEQLVKRRVISKTKPT
jgi:hypothetical protein